MLNLAPSGLHSRELLSHRSDAVPAPEDIVLAFAAPEDEEEPLLGALSMAGLDEVEITADGDRVVVRVYWPVESGPPPRVDLSRVRGATRQPDRRQTRDWAEGWPATAVGPFLIVPTLGEPAPQTRRDAGRPGKQDEPHFIVALESGQGFGFGEHPSTRLALTALAALRRPVGPRVLDVGCGTGVLSIAASFLGATDVYATDIDPVAQAATRANAARNGAAVSVRGSDAADISPFDLVLANITPPVLKALAPRLEARVARGGRMILSGLPDPDATEVVECYRPLQPSHTVREDGWVAVTLEKP